MPVVTTNLFREKLAKKEIDLINDSFSVALMDQYVSSSSENTLKAVTNWSSVSQYEVTSDGYASSAITNPTIDTINSSTIRWDGGNIVWSGVTVSPYGFAIYRPLDDLVLGFVSFVDGKVDAINGTITIEWDSRGIMNLI